jgi:hypothetical protein
MAHWFALAAESPIAQQAIIPIKPRAPTALMLCKPNVVIAIASITSAAVLLAVTPVISAKFWVTSPEEPALA